MIKNFRRWFRDWLSDVDAYETLRTSPVPNVSLNSSSGIRFTIYKASGGMVIETSSYDRVKDDTTHALYLVTDEQDLGEEINKIMTMELMRRR